MFFQTLPRLIQKLLPHRAGRATRRRRTAMHVPAECLELRRLLSATNAVQLDDAPETSAVEGDANGTGSEKQTARDDRTADNGLTLYSLNGTQAIRGSDMAIEFCSTKAGAWSTDTANAAFQRTSNDSVLGFHENSGSDKVSDRSDRIGIDVLGGDDSRVLAEIFTDQGQRLPTVESDSAIQSDHDDSTTSERGDSAVGIESFVASNETDQLQRDAVPEEIEDRAGSDSVAELVWTTESETSIATEKDRLEETIQKDAADTQPVAAELAMPGVEMMWLASKAHGATEAVEARLPIRRAANQSILLQILIAETGNLVTAFDGNSRWQTDDVASSENPQAAPESVPLELRLDADELPKVDAVVHTLARCCRAPDLFGD